MKQFFKNKISWGVLSAMALILALSSCSKDGDLVTVGKGDLIGLDGNNVIKLDKDNANGLAMTIFWNDNHQLSTNYSDVLVPNFSIANVIQISRTEDFRECSRLNVPRGEYEKQFTNKELNSELTKLHFLPFQEQDMYVRIAAVVGENIEPQYSNVLKFRVEPYKIDFSFAAMLNADKSDSGNRLFSPNEDGVYSGFLAFGAWGNWWMQENDGTIWGNDEVTGTAFVASSASTAWNFWGSKHDGCRFVTVDTKKKFWQEYAIPSVTVSGDISGDMQFDKENKKWVLTFTAADTKPLKVTMKSEDAVFYDQKTGTENGVPATVFMTKGGISTEAAEEITITPPVVGDCTLALDFSTDDEVVKYTVTEGGAEPIEKLSPVLCVMGNDDKWDHTEWIRLANEDTKTYTGAVYMDSQWGYYFTKTTDENDWAKINQDDSTSDKKLKEGGTDIIAPGKGLYIVSASLMWMSYWYEMNGATVANVSYTGLNDDWSMTQMTPTATPGVYTASVTVTKDAPWGVKILINEDWDSTFGTRADGTLTWNKVDNGNPKGVEVGKSYTLTVDICHGTYKFE